MDESLYPAIADFGLAKLINSNDPSQSLEISQSTESLKGTPPYIPPEIWDGDEYTNAVDVYALGMIIYELFSNGPPPFENEKYFKICQKVLKGERPPVGPEIPESYQKLIQDCWSQDPSSRPTFDDIIKRLKADPGFVSEEVSAVDYLNDIEYVKSHSLICPFEDFIKLDEDIQNAVVQTENEPDLLYYVGEQFLNGTDNFPQNTDLAILYLSNASNKGNIGALKCYCKMLIKVDAIERDIDLAKKYLKPLLSEKDDSIYLLYGYAMIKKPNYKVARKCFLLAIEKGNAEAMYQYGKMLYKGEGIDRDEKVAIEYFEKAKLKGYQKVDTFLDKQNKEESNKNVQNLIDIIFMVDGTFSMNHFINSLTSELGRITQKCHSNHHNDDIMYGAVIYRDTAVSRLLKKQNIEKVDCFDLTSNIKEVVTFFSKSRLYGGGGGPEDWASWFSCLLNKISWRKRLPGHGRHFTAKKRFYRQVVKIPVISKKNTERQNACIYSTKIQDRQDRVFYILVNLAAKKNLIFFCMNGSEKAMGCFQMTRDLFRKKGGKKHLIMNQFNCSFYIDDEGNENEIDMDDLKAKIRELSINAVDIAIKANSSNEDDNDNDTDNDNDEFEVNCRENLSRRN
ncbi:hypothetical protein M9Y10_023657 [Tritrichomonas musculus]|uniref:Protein kinase domain-containing protein n=1 Tax=Tritrichomonas musculus TaxID=1915356 RepID=A0ABR2KVT9_9EUKA